MKKVLRILFVEDSEDDSLLVMHHLQKGGYDVDFERVETANDMKVALKERTWQIVLSDYIMPRFNGLEALNILKESGIDIPFVVISGTIGEDVAVEAMKAGANDYIMKNNLSRLLPAIERELRESENRKKRKQAEEALKISQKKYTQIVETANEGIWVIDDNHRTSFINAQLSSILGYEMKEMIGLDIACFILDEDMPDHKIKMENRLRGIAEHYERRWIGKNGQVVWTLVSATPIFDKEHHFKGSFAMITDITDRKQAEMEVNRVNRALRMLSRTNKALIHLSDEVTLLNEVCHVVVELGGYCMAWVGRAKHDEGKTIQPIAHAGVCVEYVNSAKFSWADKEQDKSPLSASIRTGKPCIVRNNPNDPSTPPWCEAAFRHGFNSVIALPLICDGLAFGAIEIHSSEIDAFDEEEVDILTELANDLAFGISDIHTRLERAKAEHEILHREQRFKELTDLLPQTIFEADLNGTITFANKTALTTFGYTYNDVSEGINMLYMVSEQDRNDAIENMLRIVKGEPVHKTEFLMVRKNGSTFPALTFTGPIIHDNKTIGLRGTVVDISEQKRAEEELSRKNVEIENQNKEYISLNEKLKIALGKAEESDKLKSAFLANLSHEIRTPMNSIMGFASLLPEEDDEELKANYAKIIVRSSEQLVHIIDDIVLYSRLQTKLLSYMPASFNIHNLLSDVTQTFSLPEFQKDVELCVETNTEVPVMVNSDYEKLCRILNNLVSNAFKYTFSGKITIGFVPNEKELNFFVRDTGMGIPPNEVEMIFDRFYRGSNVNKSLIGGTGLGLSIVKELVDLLGGKIWVESEVGKGSIFFFSIPLSLESDSQ